MNKKCLSRYEELLGKFVSFHNWGRWEWQADGFVRKCKVCNSKEFRTQSQMEVVLQESPVYEQYDGEGDSRPACWY